jgi:hypothetical protein
MQLEHMPFPKTDPKLLTTTRIRCTASGFVVKGRDVRPGDEVTVEEYVARDLIAIEKAERIALGNE